MTTTTSEYAVILETCYNGPSRKHAILRGLDDEQTPVFDTLAEAVAAVPAKSGPTYLGHDQSSGDASVWEVVTQVDPTDWCGWPKSMTEAAVEIIGQLGVDPDDAEAVAGLETDVPTEAAQAIGCCLVHDDHSGLWLLCKPIV